MSLKRLIRKLKRMRKKQRILVCAVAIVLLVAILLVSRFLDGGGVEGDVEYEGETIPVETMIDGE